MKLGEIVRATREQMLVPERPSIDPAGKKILLVYLFTGLGDVILLAPVIKALLGRGAKQVGVVAPKNGARILARAGLSKVTLHDPEDGAPSGYDVAIDLTYRPGLDARALMDAPITLGFGEGGLTYATRDVRPQADRHWSRALIEPLRALGVSEPDYAIGWNAPKAALDWAKERWGSRGPRVLVVPGGRSADKSWSGWRIVMDALIERHRARAIVLGAPWEAKQLFGDAYTGRDLGKLVALVKSADLVLASDTGPMHLAFACGVPTVALFLRMAPESWGPPNKDARHAITRVSEGVDPTAWVIERAEERIVTAKGARSRPTKAR